MAPGRPPWHRMIGTNPAPKRDGIEHLEELGLNVNFAMFRTLDASIGRWWQVDPEAEGLYGVTPYNSMLNNPVYYTDPDGDWVHIAIGAGLGAIINVAVHWDDVKRDGFSAFAKAAIIGAAAGALTAATGNLAVGAGIAQGAAIGAFAGVSGDFVLQGGNAMFFGDEFSGKQMVLAGGLGAIGGMATSYFSRGAGAGSGVTDDAVSVTNDAISKTIKDPGLTVEQIEEIARNGVMTVDGFSDDVTSILGNTVGSKFASGITVRASETANSGVGQLLLNAGSTRQLSPFYKVSYNPRILAQEDIAHNFPKMFDDYIIKNGAWSQRIKDGAYWFESVGTMNNTKGVYQLGINSRNEIFHRHFLLWSKYIKVK